MRISPTIIRISIWIAFGLTLATGAMAQAGDKNNIVVILRPGLEKGQIETALDAARGTGRPVTVRWEDPAPVASSAPAAAPSHGLWDAFEDDLALHLQGLMRLPDLPRTVAAAWARDANAGSLPLLAAMLAIAALFAFGIHRWLYAVLPRSTDLPADAIGRLRVSASRLLIDLAALGAFGLGGWLLLRWLLPAPDMAHVLGVHLIRYGSTVALFWIAGRFLLAPCDPENRLLPLPNAAWHFRMLATYGVLGAIVEFAASLARQAGSDPAAIEGWFLLGGTIITVFKIAWFWGGRHDITALFRGDFSGREPGIIRRTAAMALPYLLIGVAVAIWFAGNVAAADPQRGHWGTIAGATQVLVILLPIAALGIDALAKSLIVRGLAPSSTPLRAATAASAHAAIAGGVWVVGLYVIVCMWDLFLPYPSSQAALAATVRIGAALVTGWAIWSFLSVYFGAHLPKPRGGQPGDEDEGEPLVQTRLTTVLPIVRELSFGATIAITALVVLSAVGVDIGPLLAGFGIVGLAISFGSQALVKDIVSGIFFMTDDAFRVGEYIDTGKLRGTVERITLRSVQLRHQNGPVHTIPFGTIGQITNFSRDWATMKFTIRLDRDADIEKARKTIKKLGQQMLEDPELGPEFLLPLKMQGVQEIADAAIVIRCKFTAKPNKPTWVQREALKRIYRALQEAGVPFASNAVMVRSGSGEWPSLQDVGAASAMASAGAKSDAVG
jgi:small-conductance mechanosensitive channel